MNYGNLELLLKQEGIDFVAEHRFHPVRRWKFDYAIIDCKIAIEIEGGTWGKKKSRHTTGKGYEGDCEKYNAGNVLGWSILRYTTNQITKNPQKVIEDIKEIMENRK